MLLFASMLFLAGCGSGDTEESADESTESTEETSDDSSSDDADDSSSDSDDSSSDDADDSSSDSDDSSSDDADDSSSDSDDSSSDDADDSSSDSDDSSSDDADDSSSDSDDSSSDDADDSSSDSDDSSSDDTDESATEDDDSDSAAGDSESADIDTSLTNETITGLDGTEISSLFSMNSGIGEELSNATESDASIEEVMMSKEEVTTYYAETFMNINMFTGGSEEPADSDLAGLTAEIDEREEFEIFAGSYDAASSAVQPYAYANSDSLFVYEGGTWNDYTGQAPAEEIFYGTYSNIYDAFVESGDIINVSEDDDNYYLHNIGAEEVLHDTFGSLFEVQFTNADLSQQKNAVVGVVDKESKELDHLAYISMAPGLAEEEELHIEIAVDFDEYGEYDESGITVPEGIYE